MQVQEEWGAEHDFNARPGGRGERKPVARWWWRLSLSDGHKKPDCWSYGLCTWSHATLWRITVKGFEADVEWYGAGAGWYGRGDGG